MKTRLFTSIFSLTLGTFFLVPFTIVQAQFTNEPTAGTITLTSVPANPAPGQTVSINVRSFNTDIDRATITWSVNGKQTASGLGLKDFVTRLGNVGSDTRISVIVLTEKGDTLTKDISFTAASVSLIWEADSYVPPLYKGKALLSRYTNAKIVAITQLGNTSTSLSPQNLIYTWKKNGRNMASVSGYSKNTLQLDRYDTAEETTVKVVVSNQEGSLRIEKEITLNPVQPKLVTYIYNPLYGTLYTRALSGNYRVSTKELSLSAVPYFFNGGPATPILTDFSWSINNTRESPTNNVFTLRNVASATGTVNISIGASNSIGSTKESDTNELSLTF